MKEYRINVHVSAESCDALDIVTDLFATWLNAPLPPDYLGRGMPGIDFEGITVDELDSRGDVETEVILHNALNNYFVMCKGDDNRYQLATSRFFSTFHHALKYAEGVAPSRCAVVLAAVGGFCDFPDCEPYPTDILLDDEVFYDKEHKSVFEESQIDWVAEVDDE